MLKEDNLVLALDGSGVASYKHPSNEFCISGVVTTRKNADKLNRQISKSLSKN